MKTNKFIWHIFVNIILFMLYFTFFGVKYFQKYMSKAVIITVEEEKSENISLPGMIRLKFCTQMIINIFSIFYSSFKWMETRSWIMLQQKWRILYSMHWSSCLFSGWYNKWSQGFFLWGQTIFPRWPLWWSSTIPDNREWSRITFHVLWDWVKQQFVLQNLYIRPKITAVNSKSVYISTTLHKY